MDEGRNRDRTHRAVAKAIAITEVSDGLVGILRKLAKMAAEPAGDSEERSSHVLGLTLDITLLELKHMALLHELVSIATEPDDLAAIIREFVSRPTAGPRSKSVEVSPDELAELIERRQRWAAGPQDQALELLTRSQRFVVAVIQVVARFCDNVPVSALVGIGQDRQITTARRYAVWLLYEHTTLDSHQLAGLIQKSFGTTEEYIRRVRRESRWSKGLADNLRRLAQEAYELARI